jgi:hypothetical protein
VVSQGFDRQPIHAELERVRLDLHQLVAQATAADLRRRTDGTRSTNGQMLWLSGGAYARVWAWPTYVVLDRDPGHRAAVGRSRPRVYGAVEQLVKPLVAEISKVPLPAGLSPLDAMCQSPVAA